MSHKKGSPGNRMGDLTH